MGQPGVVSETVTSTTPLGCTSTERTISRVTMSLRSSGSMTSRRASVTWSLVGIPPMVLSRHMALEITPVRGRADLKEFIDLPFRLHAGTPWIPPLKLERYAYLNRKLNPFFKHGDGRVVGRISAQYDTNFNSFHTNRWGFFGFLDFEDDQEIADALLDAAAAWLKVQRRDRMIGPFDLI